MVIKDLKIYSVIAGLYLLSFACTKRNMTCPKEGYIYSNSTFVCQYSPVSDSIELGSIITLEAAVPKKFIDETSNTTVTNAASILEGPLGIGMIYPTYQSAADSFELSAQVGKIIKDTAHFSEGILEGFRTIQWDGNSIDSFKMKISIKALARGIYSFALKQQSAKDHDCALYKYFLRPANANQHLNYWMDYIGNVSDQVAFFTYCIKVY